MKLAAVVVVYFPPKDLLRNMASYAHDVDKVYVWDNTPDGSVAEHNTGGGDLIDLQSFRNIAILHHNHRNMGLSFAYNRAMEQALADGCTHLMTMDQDSRFEDFLHYKHSVEQMDDSHVAMFTLPINHDAKGNDYINSSACQSGCIFRLDILQLLGGFREDLFIGMVDAEIGLKAIEKGYRIFRVGGCNLVHQIGSGREVTFLGRRIRVSDYGSMRHYYDSRNRILLWHEFPYDCNWQARWAHLVGRGKLMAKIILFENHKLAKSLAIIRGTMNGLLNKATPY